MQRVIHDRRPIYSIQAAHIVCRFVTSGHLVDHVARLMNTHRDDILRRMIDCEWRQRQFVVNLIS